MAEQIESLVNAQRRLTSDVSHELRSPLARLTVALDLARKKSGPDDVQVLDRIEVETQRLDDLIGESSETCPTGKQRNGQTRMKL